MDRIGVVGLGRMGTAIATRVASQGVPVIGWTRSGRSADGVPSAPDLQALVSASDVIVTSLYDDGAVADILDALLNCDLSGKLIVETSTVTSGPLTQRIAQIEALGGAAVDAPISGGPEMVQAGTCGIFIGGRDTDAERAKAALSAISGRIFHVGPLGTGLVMKAINNSLLQIYVTGLGQLLPMAREAGLPLKTVLAILNGGPAGMPFLRDRTPKILGEDPEVGFTLSALIKDNAVFREIAQSLGAQVAGLEMAAEAQRSSVARGFEDKDPAVIIADAYHRG